MITGAGQGIGYAIAKELLECGSNIIVVDINTEKWNEFTNSKKIHLKNFDLTKHNEIPQLISELWNVFGKIEILVNNAGLNRDNLLLKMEQDQWDLVMNLNLKTPCMLTKEVGKKMKEFSTGGTIINIVSTSGKHGNF